MVKGAGRANLCLADFVAPLETGHADFLGGFAVCADAHVSDAEARFEADHDDYGLILFKALADRLAEAFAERMHERVRREFWGYARDETLSNEDLIAERYAGIRPAPGYPACPDHTEKGPLFDLLRAPEQAGITLTEQYAMFPGAAVSGFYFKPSGRPVLWGGSHRPRPGRGLCRPQGDAGRGRGEVAGAESGLLRPQESSARMRSTPSWRIGPSEIRSSRRASRACFHLRASSASRITRCWRAIWSSASLPTAATS